jgi:hypothetical protein
VLLKLACATALVFSSHVPGDNNWLEPPEIDPVNRFEYFMNMMAT